mmetsp:Transcript_17767/g.30858  ORF Transcript_17767/g.30858 Transcript_17767/m.30858 type:complete len:233 (+) Transcript_17767:65-763(+)
METSLGFVQGSLMLGSTHGFVSSAAINRVPVAKTAPSARNSVVMNTDFKFYRGSLNNTRANQVEWYLKELKKAPRADYDEIRLDTKQSEHKDNRKNPHPFMKVPSLMVGDAVIFESGALLLYLQRKYDSQGLSELQLGEISSWVFWANASFGPGIISERTRESTVESLGVIDAIVAKRQYLTSADRLTAADIAVVYLIEGVKKFIPFDTSKFTNLNKYVQRLTSSDSYKSSI